MKDLLLQGCAIKVNFKTDPKDWLGEVTIQIFDGGYGMKPKVVVGGDIPNTDFSLDKIDDAIEYFKVKAFTPYNLWYKFGEAMRTISANNPDIDLDDEDDFFMVETQRLKLIKQG